MFDLQKQPKLLHSMIGKIVHYQSYNEKGECPYASIITAVNSDGSVELATFGPNSVYFQHGVHFSETPIEKHWSYIPKEGSNG